MLLDRQYHIAARLNLSLPPLSSDHQLPADCPLCTTGEAPWPTTLGICSAANLSEKPAMSSRHDAIVDALYHTTRCC